MTLQAESAGGGKGGNSSGVDDAATGHDYKVGRKAGL